MSYKIGLVQTSDINGGNLILPLAIGILWEYAMTNPTNRQKWQLQQVVYKKEAINETAQALAQCDLVAFSTYVWNSEYQFELARQIKELNPKCYTVFGGQEIHANLSNFWEERQQYIDLAIVGDGFKSFSLILEQWPNLNLDSIPGAQTKNYFSGEAPREENLESVPSPYLNGFYDHIIEKEQNTGVMLQVTMQTSRGCPYSCSFCDQGREYKNKVYFYNIDQVKQEFEWCGKNKIVFIALADDNWGIATRDIELMEHLCQVKLKYGYPDVIDVTFAKNAPERVVQIAKIDKKYGTNLIRGVTSALQSKNPKTLEAIRRVNLPIDKQTKYLQELRDINTPIYAELIWPLPYETYDTFLNGIDQVVESKLYDWVAIYPLNMVKSADLYNDFYNSYQWGNQKNKISKPQFHIRAGIPMSNEWADFSSVVRVHVFASWLAVMHFFGYAKLILEYLKNNHQKSVSQVIDAWITYLHSRETSTIKDFSQRIEQHWKNWLTYEHTDLLQEIPGHDTNFWHPYTYLAGFLQQHQIEFQELLNEFLFQYCSEDLSDLVSLNLHGVVRYNQTYPYTTGTQLVELTHTPPNFDNFYEFCRYYFYWNRRKGLSITKIS